MKGIRFFQLDGKTLGVAFDPLKCNLNCCFCWPLYECPNTRVINEVSLRDVNPFEIEWLLVGIQGEPLMNVDLLRELDEYFVRAKWVLVTNGTLQVPYDIRHRIVQLRVGFKLWYDECCEQFIGLRDYRRIVVRNVKRWLSEGLRVAIEMCPRIHASCCAPRILAFAKRWKLPVILQPYMDNHCIPKSPYHPAFPIETLNDVCDKQALDCDLPTEYGSTDLQ